MSIADLITRGVLKAKNAVRKMRTVQTELFADDLRDDVEHFEPYGFTSEAKPGAEVLAASLGGDREHTIAFCIADRRYRVTGLKDGEVCVFDDQGQKIYLTRSGIVIETGKSVTVKGSSITLDAPEVLCTGNFTAKGNVSDKNGAATMAGMRSTYNGHTHNGGHSPDQKM